LVIEQKQISSFPKDALEIHSASWKALQVAEGLSGSGKKWLKIFQFFHQIPNFD
jgi:hypothetical protein